MTVRSGDPTIVAFNLISESAPEHTERLREFWKKYSVRFEEVDSKCGIVLNANMDLITTQAKRNLSSRSGIGGVLSAT